MSTDKTYISAGQLLVDSFLLGAQVFRSDYRPDFIIGILRGGAPVAIAIHEYLRVRGIAVDHIAIQASSYSGVDQRLKSVQVTGMEPLLERIRSGHRLLLVDDVFDTGLTISEVLAQLRRAAGDQCPRQIRIACPWFKPARNRTPLRPDYFLHETANWLVFPHELAGLTPDEIRNKPELGVSADDLGL